MTDLTQRVILARFRKLQELKLAKHRNYNWYRSTPFILLARLHEEMDELVVELHVPGNVPKKIGLECADIANFAMGIALLVGALDNDD